MPEPLRCDHPAQADHAQLYEMLVAELTDFVVFLMDPEGCIVSWNPGVERIIGYREAEWIGQSARIIFTPEDRAAGIPQEELAKARNEGRSPDIRWHQKKDGSRFYVDGTLVALKDQSGKLLGFSKVMRDVTEKQRIQDELESAHEEVHGILESITDGFIALDQEWRFTYVNAAGEKLLGAPCEELLGRNHWEVFAPTLGTAVEYEFRRVVRDQVSVEFEMLYEPRQRWFAVKGYPTPQGGLSAYFQDVTERKNAAEEMQRQWRTFDTALSHMPDIISIFDLEGHFTYANRAALALFQRSLEEVIGKGVHKLIYPSELAAKLQQQIREVIMTRQSVRDETPYPVPGLSGAVRDYEYIFSPVFSTDGTIEAVTNSTRDITERKQAQAALERQAQELADSNAELQQFAYVTSHDLQEPLRAMVNFSQLLMKRYGGQLGTDADEFLGYIMAGAQRMNGLVESLLTYSRVLHFDQTAFAPVSLQTVVDWAVMNLRTAIDESGTVVLSNNLPTVQADQVQLVQLFQNLISNAIKYRKTGEPPRVQISAKRAKNEWIIAVQDNGMGIEKQYSDRIFGVFKRLHGKEIPGTGIGLAICKRIVEKHNGRIWVESQAGEGSTFYAALPSPV